MLLLTVNFATHNGSYNLSLHSVKYVIYVYIFFLYMLINILYPNLTLKQIKNKPKSKKPGKHHQNETRMQFNC